MQAVAYRWFPPSVSLLTRRWDADAFVFGIDEKGTWRELGKLKARIREGERLPSAEVHRRGLYRPSSIKDLSLDDSDLAPMPTSWGKLPTVGPGDVVVSKFLPVDAAWTSTVTPRRPIDSNCARIIGLKDEDGFWIANVLEHPSYQAALARLAARSALPRLGLRVLRDLRVPEAPSGLSPLVTEWNQTRRLLMKTRNDLTLLRSEVTEWVETTAPSKPDPKDPTFYAPTEIADSWVPDHMALQAFQGEAARRGWMRLGEVLSEDSERLRGRRLAALRVLRLSDANSMFGFRIPDLAELQHPSFRIYGHPLAEGEVLLSVLGSAPKIVLHHPAKQATVWLSDHWVRFRNNHHPGSLALLLERPIVTWQLTRAATGAARQFVARSDLADIRIPWPEAAVARRWHERLIRILDESAEAESKAARVRAEVTGLVDDCVGRKQ